MNFLTGDLYLHFTWIGAPQLGDADTKGPLAMSRAVSDDHFTRHLIKFWCLDEHVARFAEAFRARDNIEVLGIQKFLSSFSSTTSRLWNWYGARETFAASTIAEIVRVVCRRDASARERVNLKNAWSLFLLYSWGGYVMDSSVEPIGRSLTFPWERKMRAPAVIDEDKRDLAMSHFKCRRRAGWLGANCTTLNHTQPPGRRLAGGYEDPTQEDEAYHFDVWLLCSMQHDAGAWRAVDWFLHVWLELERWRQNPPEDFGDAEYREFSRYAIMGAVYNGLSHDGQRCVAPGDEHFWSVADLGANPCPVPTLGVQKAYGGSHAANRDAPIAFGARAAPALAPAVVDQKNG